MSAIRSKEIIRMFFGLDEILVEYRDLHWFSKYKFYVIQKGGQSKYLVANWKSKNRTISLHQLIMNPPKGLETDHINNNGLDNRRANLRIVTHKVNQNNLPKQKNATSLYKGVYYDKSRDRWTTQVYFNNKTKNIGGYKSEVEAAVAYNNFVIKNNLDKKLNVFL